MKRTLIIAGFFVAAALAAGTASAAPQAQKPAAPVLDVGATQMQKVFVTTDAQGVQHRQIKSVDRVLPGDEIVYSFPYHNVGKLPATGVAVTNAIPEHMTYVPGSAEGEGADVSFSIDGGKTWGKPESLKVKNADGTFSDAQAKDYTNIRWVVKQIVPGATVVMSYHAVLQ